MDETHLVRPTTRLVWQCIINLFDFSSEIYENAILIQICLALNTGADVGGLTPLNRFFVEHWR